MPKLILVDGHSLAYRAFYALPTDLATKAGTVTNAVYGFTSMLIKVLGDEHPDFVAVAFDAPGPTFRDSMDADYKAGRQATPAVFSAQLPLVREVLDVKMPGLDGLSAARHIASERLAAILILTAFSQRDLIERARDAGALAYLVKPFQKSELIPAIELAMARHNELTSLERHVDDLEARLEARKLIDRAKGRLMSEHDLDEQAAWRFIQTRAMNERVKIAEIARRVVDGQLAP